MAELNMDDIENDIHKKLISFCQILPQHVQTWHDTLAAVRDPVRALCNFCEQLLSVQKANLKYLDDFKAIQRDLQVKILGSIEEELESIKLLIENLNKSNHNLKNKLSTLERATIDLDWELKSPLIDGSPVQPRLDKLLQMAYDFWIFFSGALKNMNNKVKTFNIGDENSMNNFQKAFVLNLDFIDKNRDVYGLLAITQYVINKEGVV